VTKLNAGDRVKVEGEFTFTRVIPADTRLIRVQDDSGFRFTLPMTAVTKVEPPVRCFMAGDIVIDDRGLLWVRTDADHSWIRITGRRELISGYGTIRSDSQIREAGWKSYPIEDKKFVRFLVDKAGDYWWEMTPGVFSLSWSRSGEEGLTRARADYERNPNDVESESYIRQHYGPVTEGQHEE